MAEAEKKTGRKKSDDQIIGFRLPVSIAKAVKVEAARRQVKLNTLFVEMWDLYRENKRAS